MLVSFLILSYSPTSDIHLDLHQDIPRRAIPSFTLGDFGKQAHLKIYEAIEDEEFRDFHNRALVIEPRFCLY